jgi:hypothetical protein
MRYQGTRNVVTFKCEGYGRRAQVEALWGPGHPYTVCGEECMARAREQYHQCWVINQLREVQETAQPG